MKKLQINLTNIIKENKKKFISVCILIVLILGILVYKGFDYWQENRVQKHSVSTTITIDDIIEIKEGKGEYEEDSFLVLNSGKLEASFFGDISVVPKKYLILQKNKFEYEHTRAMIGISKKEYKVAEILVYDIETKELLKTIDIMPWLEKYPKYQLGGAYYDIFEGKDGNHYIKISFEEKPEIPYGKKDTVLENFEIYYNLSTGEEIKKYGKENYDDFIIGKERLEERDIYRGKILYDKKELWDKFYKENKLQEFDYELFDNDNWKKEKPKVFRYRAGSSLKINFSTPVLPKENKELYTRFPDLKKYRDQEWRMVEIKFESKPTAEEVVAMFTDESK
ncbi:hypothetical protein [Miniphocaeibacter massiliensis]|uniref:hypothetical protein n=1 Tax=Miniphocaeibacter massiliensis TaxID=2041841 RepID=UPI000C1BF0E8|nr:hypothetical protein [Miniphocaeibacter massiliensis]